MTEEEQGRLEALRRLGLFDTPPEERFDRLCRVASASFSVPVAYVSLIDDSRQCYKASCGLGGMTETTRADAICDYTISHKTTVVVPDCSKDPRFQDNPYVAGPPCVRFYLGEPLMSRDGYAVGTFCLIDLQPREVDEAFLEQFLDMARMAEAELNLLGLVGAQRALLDLRRGMPSLEVESALGSMVEALLETLPQERLAIVLQGDRGWQVAASSEPTAEISVAQECSPWGSGLCPVSCFPDRRECSWWGVWPLEEEGYVVLERDTDGGLDSLQQEVMAGFASQVVETLEHLRFAQELLESKKMAAVGSMAAGVAHEINSPLGAVLLRIDSALRKLEKPEIVRKRLEKAASSASRAKVIIQTLLMFAEDQQGPEGEHELGQTFAEALAPVEAECQEKGLELSIDLQGEGTVKADPAQLRQLLRELVDNAIAATAESGGEIVVQTQNTPEAFVLMVGDNGAGFQGEALTRAFDPFFTTKPVGSGMGLGLSVCHRIVTRLGGTIKLESASPGAKAIVSLPV